MRNFPFRLFTSLIVVILAVFCITRIDLIVGLEDHVKYLNDHIQYLEKYIEDNGLPTPERIYIGTLEPGESKTVKFTIPT